MSFLDVLISKSDIPSVATTTYRKPTYTGFLTNLTSFTSLPYKIGLIKTLVDRACKINSCSETLNNDLSYIREILLKKNMFPQHILQWFIKPLQGITNLADSLPSNNESRFYKLLYIGNFSTQLKAKINNIISKYCKPGTNVRFMLILLSKRFHPKRNVIKRGV